MKLDNAKLLREKAEEIARIYSDSKRNLNWNNETFQLKQVIPLSESVAVAIFEKTPSKKKALCIFFYVQGENNKGFWLNFFPTDSHILGMKNAKDILQKVEAYNFNLNFEEAK